MDVYALHLMKERQGDLSYALNTEAEKDAEFEDSMNMSAVE